MLTIPPGLYREMVGHCREEAPAEACGILSGPLGSNTPTALITMTNAVPEPENRHSYQLDPVEQIRVWRALDQGGLWPVVLYHSHPRTSAKPSSADRLNHEHSGRFWVIVSLRDPQVPEVRAYRLVGHRQVAEEPITIGEG